MAPATLDNASPIVHTPTGVHRTPFELAQEADDTVDDPIDALEVFEHIRGIGDPEHPHTLEELKVVQPELIQFRDGNVVHVEFTPTVPHCSMATLIGLCIRVRLLRTLPKRFKVDVCVSPGSHASEHAVNKQLNDKERVAAALENRKLLDVVNGCLEGKGGSSP